MKLQKNLSTFKGPGLHGLPSANYKCAACSDSGYIEVFNPQGVKLGIAPCKCELRRAKIRKFGDLFADKSLENYEGRNASMREAVGYIRRHIGESFYIYGDVGLGKTHLLAGIYDKLFKGNQWQTTGVFKENALLNAVKTENLIARVRDYTGFIIDDLGKVKLAPWETEALFNFYDDVYRFEKMVVISSNYSLQDIAAYYGGAIARRIEERATIIKIEGGK